jgi:MFS transporter, NNP family, nitrate/nitrite transporter
LILQAFLRAGHLPTLAASLFHFEMSFTIWILMGGLIAADLGLSPAEKGLVVGIPLLGGASGGSRSASWAIGSERNESARSPC